MKYSENYIRMMDISVNLARVGNWAADNYDGRKNLIIKFLAQTEEYLKEVKQRSLPDDVKQTLLRFDKHFQQLKNEAVHPKNIYDWAEKALTWANILQHRAKLA